MVENGDGGSAGSESEADYWRLMMEVKWLTVKGILMMLQYRRAAPALEEQLICLGFAMPNLAKNQHPLPSLLLFPSNTKIVKSVNSVT